jgi:hypothetical protein
MITDVMVVLAKRFEQKRHASRASRLAAHERERERKRERERERARAILHSEFNMTSQGLFPQLGAACCFGDVDLLTC